MTNQQRLVGTEAALASIKIATNTAARTLIVDPEACGSCFIRCRIRARGTRWLRTPLVFARGRRSLMESKHRHDQFDNVRRLRLTRATASSKKRHKRKKCPPLYLDAMISCRDVVLNRVLDMSSLYMRTGAALHLGNSPQPIFLCQHDDADAIRR